MSEVSFVKFFFKFKTLCRSKQVMVYCEKIINCSTKKKITTYQLPASVGIRTLVNNRSLINLISKKKKKKRITSKAVLFYFIILAYHHDDDNDRIPI